ncbi:MAG: response regulator, partial [Thermodesulfobacteriota bacterium]
MNRRILIVDDEEYIHLAYQSILAPPDEDLRHLESKAAVLAAGLFGPGVHPEERKTDTYELVSALQGEVGYHKVEEALDEGRPFALAFIDIRMPPGWDGLETAKKIRAIDPNLELVIVTAYSDRDRREIVEQVGPPEKLLYLKKPFDPDEIRQLAQSLTRKWDLEQKEKKHREYLEQILSAVRRLKTLSITTVREVLAAILNEVMYFVNAGKGFVAKLADSQIEVEIVSEGCS